MIKDLRTCLVEKYRVFFVDKPMSTANGHMLSFDCTEYKYIDGFVHCCDEQATTVLTAPISNVAAIIALEKDSE